MVTSGPPALVGLLACSLQLPLPVIEPSRGAEGLLSFAESGRPGSSFCFLWSSSIPSAMVNVFNKTQAGRDTVVVTEWWRPLGD